MCEKLGMEAIRVLPWNLIIRGEIADVTAIATKELGHHDTMNECYVATFYAKSTMRNYLRLFELSNYHSIVDKEAKYALTLLENLSGEYSQINKQLLVNTLALDHKKIDSLL